MFQKSEISRKRLRIALSGASGSGKTYSALAIASNLGSPIAVIDTEHGSASCYSDLFEFDSCCLTQFHPSNYIEAINFASSHGYKTLIIDSLSHAWFAELEIVDQSYNKFSAWAPVRKLERKLMQAILDSNCHVIATMRSKTDWDSSVDPKTGKKKVQKIGTSPVQFNGIEYEFDIAGELDSDHILTISKSRYPQISDRTFLKPGRVFALELLDWIKPWHNWNNIEDAINWANRQLPGYTSEYLEAEFSKLNAPQGKKSIAWVAHIRQLKKENLTNG